MSGKKNVIRFSQRLLPTLVLGLLLLGVLLLGWWLAPTGWFERYPQDLPPISRSGMDTAVERRLDLLLNSLLQQPETARAWGDVAILLDLHQQEGPALECYRKAMELDPTEVRWPYLGGICASLGDSDEAFRLFEVAATMIQHAPLSIRQGQINLQRGEYDRADQLFRTALSIDDQLIQGHLGLARCALVTSDLAAAAAHLDRCEQLQPEAGEVASARAHWWRLKGDAQKAQQQLEAATTRAPREPLPDLLRQQAVMEQGVGPKWMRERSRRLLAAGDSQGAIDLWQQSILDDPQDAASRMELGRVAQQLKKPLLALQEYTEAARLDPDLVEAHLALGVLRMRRGDPAGAEKALRQGLVLDSTSHEILTNLGALMMTTGRGVEGVQFLQRACKVAPDDADV
ncbi:MAG: tetratricopeptide repeat protein, partial [Planctomycetes bacterium]|nr:tetratricopeptide repeat protein [Planctomycetota bacterium]